MSELRLRGPRYKIDLQHNPIRCDCSNYELIIFNNRIYPWLKFVQGNLECANSRGTLVRRFRLTDIRCKVAHNCPKDCECISTPALNQIVLNCSEKQLRSLPSRLEFGGMKVKLDLSGRALERIGRLPAAIQVREMVTSVGLVTLATFAGIEPGEQPLEKPGTTIFGLFGLPESKVARPKGQSVGMQLSVVGAAEVYPEELPQDELLRSLLPKHPDLAGQPANLLPVLDVGFPRNLPLPLSLLHHNPGVLLPFPSGHQGLPLRQKSLPGKPGPGREQALRRVHQLQQQGRGLCAGTPGS